MKLTVFISLFMFATSAFAIITEVECKTQNNGKFIYAEIEEAFPRGTSFNRAKVEVSSAEDGSQTFNYIVTTRRYSNFNRINYYGGGFRLEVDFWPDRVPRWGRTYRGNLSSSALGNKFIQMECRYPNAF